MKFNQANPITKILPPGTQGNLPSNPNDLIGRIDSTAKTIKGVLELALKAKGYADPPPDPPPPARAQEMITDSSRRPAPGLIDSLITQGLGDKTIAELYKQLAPFTLKQIAEYMKNAGFKQ
tara:strand:+ start:250 stop:612 length:363 start_codon:yes stop_codon:yes gene_type:complete